MLRTFCAAALLTVTTLTGTAVPAHADATDLTIEITSAPGSAPAVALSPGDPGALVGAVSGTIGGEPVDLTSCEVTAGQAGTVVLARCAGGGEWSVTLTPTYGGGVAGVISLVEGGTGTVSGSTDKWKFEIDCDFVYVPPAFIGIKCHITFTTSG